MYVDHRLPNHEYFFYDVHKDLSRVSWSATSNRNQALRVRREAPDLKVFLYDGIFYVLKKADLRDIYDNIRCAEKSGLYRRYVL